MTGADHLFDPQALYRQWEGNQWSPWEFDLAADHIGYGTWFLRQTVAHDPAMGDVVRQTLRDLLPAVAEALAPPEGADASILGTSADELRAFALDGLTRRLNIIGVPLETL